jgi:hypothetical protein
VSEENAELYPQCPPSAAQQAAGFLYVTQQQDIGGHKKNKDWASLYFSLQH